MKGNKFPPGAVIVDDDVVNPRHFGVALDKVVNGFDKFGARRRAQQQVDRLFRGLETRKENEARDEYPRPAVDCQPREFCHQGGNEDERGGHDVGNTVEGGRLYRGRIDQPADFAVEEKQPQLDENRRPEQYQREGGDGGKPGGGDFLDGRLKQFRADENDQHIDNKTRDIFQPAVSQRVFLIHGLGSQTEADERDDGRARVGDVIEGVRDHRDGRGQKPRRQLPRKQKQIQ